MRKRFIWISICLIGSVIFVTVLALMSSSANEAENGFIRNLPPLKIVGESFKNIKNNAWYIGGANDSGVYLGNNIVPGRIAKVDNHLTSYSEISLTGFDTVKIHRGAYIQIDSLNLYLMDGTKPLILRANIVDLHFRQRLKATYFTGGIPLTYTSLALRSIYEGVGAVLIKKNLESEAIKTTKLLQKQIDGIFCTDGELVKVPGPSSKMIYVYYYRNQFLCTDSNLNLLYKGKTIDTISRAQIKVAKIVSTGETTMAAPPLYVNKRACANSKYLFVQSALRANNETEYMIKDVSMIDVYAIADGKYQFSFYLPDFRGFKVRDFKVYGQSLYALYDHYLYKYQLNF